MPNIVINRNPTLQTNFKLIIPGLDSFVYFITATGLPGMTMNGIEAPYKSRFGALPSDRIDYEALSVDFIVSEDLSNHDAIRDWMKTAQEGDDSNYFLSCTKNIVLLVMSSNMQPLFKYEFSYAFPSSISTLNFTSQTSDDDPLTANVTFRYQEYWKQPVI